MAQRICKDYKPGNMSPMVTDSSIITMETQVMDILINATRYATIASRKATLSEIVSNAKIN